MTAQSDVTVSRSVVLREWGWMAGRSVALRFVSKTATQEQQLAALTPGMPDLIERVSGQANVTGPLGFLDSTVVLIYDCDQKAVLLSIVDEIVEMMRAAGLVGRLTCGGGYAPLQHDFVPGFVAGVVLPITSGGPDKWSGNPTWHPDPVALDTVIDYALDWCRIEGARYWIGTGVGILTDQVYPDQISPLLRASLRQSPYTTIQAVDGQRIERASKNYRAEKWDVARVRRVEFDLDGHVAFKIGGHESGWLDSTNVLRTVLRDLAPHVVYGMVVPVSRVGDGSWDQLTSQVKGPELDMYRDGTIRGKQHEPGIARTRVVTAFGVQLLGPEHAEIPLPNSWVTENLAARRRLVSHKDPAAWFSHGPNPDLLAASRRDFIGLLEDDELHPTSLSWCG